MKVEAEATSLEVWPGVPTTLSVSVFNTGDVICGYTFEMLGVDAEWLRLDYDQLNLFPDDSGTVTLTLTLPMDFPAGVRNLAIVVQSALAEDDYRVIDVELDIQATLEARLQLEPSNFYGGRTGTFGMVITNTGNSWTRMVPIATDEEAKAQVDLVPGEVDVPPGEQVTVVAEVRRRRPFIGAAATRILTFRVDGVDDPPQAVGSFTQRPIIGRGILSLAGLLAALTVFGFVLTNSLGALVDKTDANDELLAQALDREEEQLALAAANPSAMQGTVVRETAAGVSPVGNVTVQLYAADDGSEPIGVVATDEDGVFSFAPIVAGEYKLKVLGAGFAEAWYPGAPTFDDAETIALETGQTLDDLAISVRSRPALISGAVLAADPSDVVISLIQLVDGARVATARELTTDGSGVFVLENVPLNLNAAGTLEPYELVAVKEGFAEERRLITVGEGEIRDDIRIRLRTGDARLSGTVTLDGRTADTNELIQVTASADGEQYATVTFGGGQFVFRDLPSPTLYSITASRDGFTSETRTRRMEAGGTLADVTLDLRTNTRSIGGRTADATTSTPVAGVLVSVTDGQVTKEAKTGADGLYRIEGLSPRSTYTLTATHPAYRNMTLSCGPAGGGCASGQPDADFRLRRATSSVSGVVCRREAAGGSGAVTPLGNVTVDLTSASFEATTLTANSATSNIVISNPYEGAPCQVSDADRQAGRLDGFYRFLDVPLGTYTITFTQEGGLPFTQVITVPTSGPVHQTLVDTSSIAVTVLDQDGAAVTGADVEVHTKAAFEANPERQADYDATTGTDGRVVFSGVEAPEEYVVIVRYLAVGDDQEQQYSRSFPLRVGESKSEEIRVRR